MKDCTYEEDDVFGDAWDEALDDWSDEMEKKWKPKKALSLPGSLTQDEISKLYERYKEIEARYNIEVEDLTADTMGADILKEVTFKNEPDSEPLRIYMNWEDVMYDEDGNELSSYEMENKEADAVECFMENI